MFVDDDLGSSVNKQDVFLAGLEGLVALLEKECIDKGVNTTCIQVESLLEDSVLNWCIDWDILQE
jgi:hypothetical protein